MRVLFIGGTGNISEDVSKLAVSKGIDLCLLNRGKQNTTIPGVTTFTGDIHQPDDVKALLKGEKFDVVVNWVAFKSEDIENDIALFRDIAQQYISWIQVSSATVHRLKNTISGVFTPKHFLGLVLSRFSAYITCLSVIFEKSLPFGKYWRSNPFVFSLVPLSQEA